jgi:hypothetical protein
MGWQRHSESHIGTRKNTISIYSKETLGKFKEFQDLLNILFKFFSLIF